MLAPTKKLLNSFLSCLLSKNGFYTGLRLCHRIVLNSEDIEEKFVKGWGKGGQKVNKTSNCVELKHIPTGLIVKCHKSRSLTRNRAIARETLEKKLDFLINGKNSVLGQKIVNTKKRKSGYVRKRKAKEEAIRQGAMDSNEKDFK